METKAKNLYPNLFSISANGDQIRPNPPLYSDSQQHYEGKEGKTQSSTQTAIPLNGNNRLNPNQQRVNWSPPGALE